MFGSIKEFLSFMFPLVWQAIPVISIFGLSKLMKDEVFNRVPPVPPYSLEVIITKEFYLTLELVAVTSFTNFVYFNVGSTNSLIIFTIWLIAGRIGLTSKLYDLGQVRSVDVVHRTLREILAQQTGKGITFFIFFMCAAYAVITRLVYDSIMDPLTFNALGSMRSCKSPRTQWIPYSMLLEFCVTFWYCKLIYYHPDLLHDDIRTKSVEFGGTRLFLLGVFGCSELYFNPITAFAFEMKCGFMKNGAFNEFLLIDVLAHVSGVILSMVTRPWWGEGVKGFGWVNW